MGETEEEEEPTSSATLPWAVVGTTGWDELQLGVAALGWTLKRGSSGKQALVGHFESGWLGSDALAEMRVLARALASTLQRQVELVEWATGARGKPRAQGRAVDERGVWASERFEWAKSNLDKVTLPAPPEVAENPKQFPTGPVALTVGDDWCVSRGGAHGPAVKVSGPGVEPHELDRSAALYVRWRLLVLDHACVGGGPDLSRWERRAMRRADLDAVPAPGARGWDRYREVWLDLTAAERGQSPGHSHLVAGWKFDPGVWVFDADELAVMRRSLPTQPTDHEPNAWQQGVWEQFGELVEKASGELIFDVPPR